MSTLPENTILGKRFRIMGKPLGRGGFAITYPGWDIQGNRPVAIKELFPSWGNGGCLRGSDGKTVLPARPADFALQRDSFFREAQVLQTIDHPGVVQVYETFEENGTVYLVMEHIQGEPLWDRCEGKPLPVPDALALFTKLAEALECVHGRGVLHRDLNPKNVLIARSGPVLIDFGLARQGVSDSETLTAACFPGFAPLEQYSPKGARGPFVDVYSVSALLYLMLTGQAPEPSIHRYDPDTGKDRLIPPQVHRTGLEAWLCEGIRAGLSLGASKRPASIADLCERLQKPQPLRPVVVVSKPPKPTPAAPSQILVRPSFGLTIEEARALPPTHPAPLTLAEYTKQMIEIPGGTFWMGSDDLSMISRPRHQVTLSKFLMGRTPVTVAMYQQFCIETGRDMPSPPLEYVWKGSWKSVQDHPIVNVSWEDCEKYSIWAGLELPTEAQWEYIAANSYYLPVHNISDRTVVLNKFNGDVPVYGSNNVVLNQFKGTIPVSRSNNVLKDNYGVIDMHGNVHHWCSNWCDSYTKYKKNNPGGPLRGSSKIFRGSSWEDKNKSEYKNMNTFRCTGAPDLRLKILGFRLSLLIEN